MYDPGTKASRSNPVIKRVLAATFPEYRGRLIRVRQYTGPQMLTVCWDEGSRDTVKVIDMTRGIGHLSGIGAPWQNPDGCLARVDQPAGSLLVVHSIVCGQDRGITITVRPGSVEAGHVAGLLS